MVGSGKQTQRDRETERLGGLKIDHQFVLGRRLHRKIGGLLALENAIDVAGGSGRCSKVLCRPSVRGHRPEIMFGVLVVVFCPNRVTA